MKLRLPRPSPFRLTALAWALALGPWLLVVPARSDVPTPVPTELRSESLEMTSTDTETTAIATGNVILTGTNLRITCDRLTVIATRIGDKDATIGTVEKFKYILATGNVHITQGDREATSARAEVFPREDKVILSGGPVIIDKSNGMVASGEPLILLRSQRAVLGSNVKITAPPIGDLSATAAPRNPSAPQSAPVAPAVTFPRPGAK